MTPLSINQHHIPLTGFATVRLNSTSEEFGLLFPQRHDMGPLVVNGDGKALFALPLGGAQPFHYFRLGMGGPIRGILFRQLRLAVDLTSHVNHNAEAPLGALTFSSGKAAILASDARDHFNDAEPFALPIDAEASDEVPIAFKRWSIWTMVEDQAFELWRGEAVEPPEKAE